VKWLPENKSYVTVLKVGVFHNFSTVG